MKREEMESKFPEGTSFRYDGNEYCNIKYSSTKFLAERIEAGYTIVFNYDGQSHSNFSPIPKPEFKFTKEPDGWAENDFDIVCYCETPIEIVYKKIDHTYGRCSKTYFKRNFKPRDPPKDKSPWGLE